MGKSNRTGRKQTQPTAGPEYQPVCWDTATVAELERSFRANGRAGARKAFPQLREAQVNAAIIRYINAPTGKPAPLLPRDEIRERMAALERDLFFERLLDLVTWTELRFSTPKKVK